MYDKNKHCEVLVSFSDWVLGYLMHAIYKLS